MSARVKEEALNTGIVVEEVKRETGDAYRVRVTTEFERTGRNQGNLESFPTVRDI